MEDITSESKTALVEKSWPSSSLQSPVDLLDISVEQQSALLDGIVDEVNTKVSETVESKDLVVRLRKE